MGRYKNLIFIFIIVISILSGCIGDKSENSDDNDKAPDETFATSIYVSGEDVYISGYREKCTSWDAHEHECNSTDSFPGYWKNEEWHPFDTHDGQVYSIIVSGSDVYCAGYVLENEKSVGGYWKNDTWIALPAIDSSWSSVVKTIVLSGTDVYTGGYCYNNMWRRVAGYWKNGVWNLLSPVDAQWDSEVTTIVVSDGDVYAGGCNSGEGSGFWKNGVWTTLCNYAINSNVLSLAVSGSDVYAAGWRTNLIGDYFPGYWINGTWRGLESPQGLNHGPDSGFDIVLSGSDVYIGGYIIDNDDNDLHRWGSAGYWKNGTWNSLASGELEDKVSQVMAIAVSGTDIYASGLYVKKSGDAAACYWKNDEVIFLKIEE